MAVTIFHLMNGEKVKYLLNICIDIITANIKQPFGEADLFMKARAVGYIDEEN